MRTLIKFSYPVLNKSFLGLIKKNSFRFSTAPNHPTIDKILKSEDLSSMQVALSEVGGLSEKNREMALKIVLNKIFSGKLPLNIFHNQKLNGQLSKHPGLMLQALLFRIKQLMKSLTDGQTQQKRTETMNSINDSFISCFDTLKKVNGSLSTKYEVMLHKRFADYNLLYLSKSVSAANRKEILQKSRDFYISSLLKMGTLIKEQQQKLKKITDSTPQGQEIPQQQELRANASKENIRMLIETNSENAFHLFMTEKELSFKGKTEQQLPENIIGLLPYLQKSLIYYQIFKKMTAYSIFYHRIKKLTHEINYYSKIIAFRKHNTNPNERRDNQKQLWSQLLQNLEKLYKETVEDIKAIGKEPRHMGSLQEMTLLLLSIRLHKIMKQQLSKDDFKQQLLLEISSILELITPEDRKSIASHLGKVAKQMLLDRQGQNQSKV